MPDRELELLARIRELDELVKVQQIVIESLQKRGNLLENQKEYFRQIWELAESEVQERENIRA